MSAQTSTSPAATPASFKNAPRHPGGRPPKFGPDIAERIYRNLRGGCTPGDAAALAGIARSIFHVWLKRGRSPATNKDGSVRAEDRPFVEFADRVEESLAAYKTRLVLSLGKQAVEGGNDRAARWLLERRFPEEFGRHDRVDVAGVEGAPPIQVFAWTPSRRREEQA